MTFVNLVAFFLFNTNRNEKNRQPWICKIKKNGRKFSCWTLHRMIQQFFSPYYLFIQKIIIIFSHFSSKIIMNAVMRIAFIKIYVFITILLWKYATFLCVEKKWNNFYGTRRYCCAWWWSIKTEFIWMDRELRKNQFPNMKSNTIGT